MVWYIHPLSSYNILTPSEYLIQYILTLGNGVNIYCYNILTPSR